MTRGEDVTETGLDPSASVTPAAGAGLAAGTIPVRRPPIEPPGPQLSPAQWGMISFLVSEVSLFSTLIVVYLSYLGKDASGPKPGEVLSLPLVIVTTICLLSSSFTIHLAEKALRHGTHSRFCQWWGLSIVLGMVFLLGTAYEWRELIVRHKLTISRNLFGTTYYTLVGFHALHVTAGVITMLVVLGLALGHRASRVNDSGVELVSWYWHFVDVVWVVVFSVVYVFGR
jgi:cytochrome c oxidase subunit 3/cytochrome o ubiquinol oxidase subunit 3